MNISRRDFMKAAGLSAAAVAGAALFTGCSSQGMLPLQFDRSIGDSIARGLDEKKLMVADLPTDRTAAIEAVLKNVSGIDGFEPAMYKVASYVRKTSTLDGNESDYLYVTLKPTTGSVNG